MTDLFGMYPMYQNQCSPGWPNPGAAVFQPGQLVEQDVSGASTTCSETLSLESSPRVADTMPRCCDSRKDAMKGQMKFLLHALDRHVARERDWKARSACDHEAFQALQARLEETTAVAEQVPHLKKMLAEVEVELDEERRWKGCLENDLDVLKAKKVKWQRLVQGCLKRISDLEEQLRWSEAAAKDGLQEVEDLKIELDKDGHWRCCLENELARKDGVLKTVCHCDKDNTWRRSLGGNSVESDESRPDNEDLLKPARPGTPSETKSPAARPEVFDIGADSEDEAEVSLIGSDLKSLDEGCSPLIEPSVSMPGPENWRWHCGASDKQTYVAEADRDGLNGQASTFHPVACDSKSLIEVDGADGRAAFGKDETACEPLLTSDCKAEREAGIFTTLLELCKQSLERTLPGAPTGTKSQTVGKKLERHRVSDASTRLPEDDLEEQDASDASSPGEGSDPNSLQMDILSEVPDEMMEVPQIDHQDQVDVIQEQDGFLPHELWPRLLEFVPVDEVMKMQTRAVSHFFSDSKAWVAHLVQLMDLDAFPAQLPTDSKHPAAEWLKYASALARGEVETITEMKREGSEGFQGYRIWFDGLCTWHSLCPEMALRSVAVMIQHYDSVGPVQRCFWFTLMASGVQQIRLPMAKGLLPVLCSKDLQRRTYEEAIEALGTCRSVFHHLTPNCVAQLLESVTSWTDKELLFAGMEQTHYIMEMVLDDDRDICIATHYAENLVCAIKGGRTDAAAANKQKLLTLLTARKECS